MDKGKSDRGVRTEQSGVDENIRVADATSGDEGIDDTSGDEPFIPGKPEKYGAERSNDMEPESMGDNSAEDRPQRITKSSGAVSKSGAKPL